MQAGCLCRDMENLECHILDVPEIHGSSRIVKLFVEWDGDGGKGRIG